VWPSPLCLGVPQPAQAQGSQQAGSKHGSEDQAITGYAVHAATTVVTSDQRRRAQWLGVEGPALYTHFTATPCEFYRTVELLHTVLTACDCT